MKKNLIIFLLLMGLPSLAVCSITGGACSLNMDPIGERLVPNHLNELINPPKLQEVNQLDDLRYNLEPPESSGVISPSTYDSGCQFGACVGRPALPNR